jgi:hypothetical protein
MSWWDTGNDDDVIGDEAADLVRHGLERIVEKTAGAKPRLADLLRAIGVVAITNSGKLLDGVPNDLHEIVAQLKSDQTISSGVLSRWSETNDVVSMLNENLAEVAQVYTERWERNPRLTEWLETFSFVLRARPEKFLSDGSEHPPSEITVA